MSDVTNDDLPQHDPDAFQGECRCLSCWSRRAEAWDRASRTCPIARLVPMALARGDDLYDFEGRLIATISYGAEGMEKIRPWLERAIALSPPPGIQPNANKDAAIQPARPTRETD